MIRQYDVTARILIAVSVIGGGMAAAIWIYSVRPSVTGQETVGSWAVTIFLGLFVGGLASVLLGMAGAVLIDGAAGVRRLVTWARAGYWLVEARVHIRYQNEEGVSAPHRVIVRARNLEEARKTALNAIPSKVEREAVPASLREEPLWSLHLKHGVHWNFDTTIVGWSKHKRGPFLQVTEAPAGESE